jgi:hypothetical protein
MVAPALFIAKPLDNQKLAQIAAQAYQYYLTTMLTR